jgi:hypothetical protein
MDVMNDFFSVLTSLIEDGKAIRYITSEQVSDQDIYFVPEGDRSGGLFIVHVSREEDFLEMCRSGGVEIIIDTKMEYDYSALYPLKPLPAQTGDG